MKELFYLSFPTSFSLFPCLCVSMLFESLVEIKNKSKAVFILLKFKYTKTTVEYGKLLQYVGQHGVVSLRNVFVFFSSKGLSL